MNNIFFNGTPMNYSKNELASVYKALAELKLKDELTEEMFDLLVRMEHTLDTVINQSKEYAITYKSMEKTIKLFDEFKTVADYKTTWGSLVLYLIEQGVLCDDDNTGLLLISDTTRVGHYQFRRTFVTSEDANLTPEQLEAVKSTCKNLFCDFADHAKFKCACLKVRYCCKECQVKDWKRHKPQCSYISPKETDIVLNIIDGCLTKSDALHVMDIKYNRLYKIVEKDWDYYYSKYLDSKK